MTKAIENANNQRKSRTTASAAVQQKGKKQKTTGMADKRAEKNLQKKLGEMIANSPKMTGQQALNQQIQGQGGGGKGVIQAAWIGRRGLAHSEWLKWGVTGEHQSGHGVFHEHIFYEDDREPRNQGFGPNGVFTEGDEGYVRISGGYNDAHVRLAAQAHSNNGEYNLTDNNCQQWVNKVLKTYFAIRKESPKSKVQEEEGIEMTEFRSNIELNLSKLPPGEYEMY